MADDLIAAFSENKVNGEENRQLDLVQLRLREVPSALLDLTGLQNLCLDYNKLLFLPDEFCRRLPNISTLSLDGNNLTTLPENIGNLTYLKELCVNENNLTRLPESLASLCNLEILKLVGNELKTLPSNFGHLTNLKELSVDENGLKRLPETFSCLTKLERLDLSQNKLKRLPCEFGNLNSLRFLDLSENRLTALPDSFSLLPVLSCIDLTDNLICCLPETFASAETVTKLFMDNNNLNYIPLWFSNTTNLEELSLQNNHLRNAPFPTDFGRHNRKLRTIDLRGNYISSLPESICELKNLELIDMGSILYELERRRSLFNGNFLVHLPSTFGSLVTLKEVHLDENVLEDLPDSFGSLVNLEILDLNHNKLARLPDSFCNLAALTVCMLSINCLVELPKDIGNLQSLTELRLDNNMLIGLPESFSQLTKLHTLDLYCNSLNVLPPVLKSLTNLKRLDLNENDFGIPTLEVPEISFKARYRDRDPTLKDNWRGRKRADILDSQLIRDGGDNGLQHLQMALEQGLSLWRKHGQDEDTRAPAPLNGDSASYGHYPTNKEHETSDDSEDDDHHSFFDCTEEEEKGEADNHVSDWLISTTVSNAEPEYWDLDLEPVHDPYGYYEDVVGPPTILDQKPAPPPKPFLPSDRHPAPFQAYRVFSQASQGQFDDAD